MHALSYVEQAERCRALAGEFLGKQEQSLLLSMACSFDELAVQYRFAGHRNAKRLAKLARDVQLKV